MSKVKIIALIVGSIFGITTIASVAKYITWRNHFEIEKKDMVCYTALSNVDSIEESVKGKLENMLDDEKNSYIEFSVEEILVLLREYADAPTGISVLDACVKPKNDIWMLYLQTKVTALKAPWIGITLQKDESGSLKANKASIADVSFPIPTVEQIYYKAHDLLHATTDKMMNYVDTMDDVDKKIELHDTKIIFNNSKR
ncbi:MAG: hypothetical protein ACOX06_00945 [Candidatus Dojkabacteria bacterium]|jgi:hypothetical protein